MPRVSVLMPVRNASAHLRQAVRSVLRQTWRDFEVIAVDDGSTDQSVAILREMVAEDPRLRVVECAHRGVSTTLNYAGELARGEYLARMDADDLTAPERFSDQVAFMDAHPTCVALGTYAEAIDAHGWPLGVIQFPTEHSLIVADLLDISRRGAGLCHPSAMIRASAFRAIGGYSTRFTRAQDRDLWLRLSDVGNLANLPRVMHRLRMHHGSVSQQNLRENFDMRWLAINDACTRRNLPPLPYGPPPDLESTRDDKHYSWAMAAAGSGHTLCALKHGMLFLAARPWSPSRYFAFMRIAGKAFIGSRKQP